MGRSDSPTDKAGRSKGFASGGDWAAKRNNGGQSPHGGALCVDAPLLHCVPLLAKAAARPATRGETCRTAYTPPFSPRSQRSLRMPYRLKRSPASAWRSATSARSIPAFGIGNGDEFAIRQIYNTLVSPPDGTTRIQADQLQGELAESWEMSPDARTWTFHLRHGVQWHKGFGEFTSDDVAFTVKRMSDPRPVRSIPPISARSPASIRLMPTRWCGISRSPAHSSMRSAACRGSAAICRAARRSSSLATRCGSTRWAAALRVRQLRAEAEDRLARDSTNTGAASRRSIGWRSCSSPRQQPARSRS